MVITFQSSREGIRVVRVVWKAFRSVGVTSVGERRPSCHSLVALVHEIEIRLLCHPRLQSTCVAPVFLERNPIKQKDPRTSLDVVSNAKKPTTRDSMDEKMQKAPRRVVATNILMLIYLQPRHLIDMKKIEMGKNINVVHAHYRIRTDDLVISGLNNVAYLLRGCIHICRVRVTRLTPGPSEQEASECLTQFQTTFW